MKTVLIIANARIEGGLSGSDNIYENFLELWPSKNKLWCLKGWKFRPFFLNYILKIIWSCIRAIFYFGKADFVYTASDFLMDCLPGFILRLKGYKWVAGFYLFAPKDNKVYFYSQKMAYIIIRSFAHVVCVTNGSMFNAFKNKKLIGVNGGISISYIDLYNKENEKQFDAVWCNRIHKTKGVDELIKIWQIVEKVIPDAVLGLIGDGDLGIKYIHDRYNGNNIRFFGFLDDKRYSVYWDSRCVMYTATYDHFSMAPVEAMACYNPMIAFDLPVMQYIQPKGTLLVKDVEEFAEKVIKTILASRKATYQYYKLKNEAREYATTWDWKNNAKRVWEEINKFI